MPPTAPAETVESTATTERLVLFTDAVTAIALTLLVLPLVDTVTSEPEGFAVGRLVDEHLAEFWAFVLSFAVIFRIWWAHHQIFRHLSRIDGQMVGWSVLWTFAIVFLPVPTAIITATPPSAGTVAMYGGTLVLASGASTMLAAAAYRHPELGRDRPRMTPEEVLGNATAFVAQLVAVVVGCVFADTVNYFAFLLIFLTGPFERVVKARWRARAEA